MASRILHDLAPVHLPDFILYQTPLSPLWANHYALNFMPFFPCFTITLSQGYCICSFLQEDPFLKVLHGYFLPSFRYFISLGRPFHNQPLITKTPAPPNNSLSCYIQSLSNNSFYL